MSDYDIVALSEMAKRMQINIIKLAYMVGNKGAHIAPALSCNEIMAVLYGCVMHLNPSNPKYDDRDRFLLGKGHGALALYAALHEAGLISKEKLFTYQENGGGGGDRGAGRGRGLLCDYPGALLGSVVAL